MQKLLAAACVVAAFGANAADVGNVAVIEDTSGAIHGAWPLQSGFCKETAKAFFQTHPDQFDGLVTFTTKQLNDLENVQQGTPVIWDTQGIGTNNFDWSSQYGSNHKLSQCVFMASLAKLPSNPDGPATALFGLPLGITGVELVGHEYGHHWLVWVMYDKNDGQGPRHLLRGYENGSPNGHYNHYADSHSVMYGSFITDNGNGSFTLAGGDRKYGYLDQYLMGLRAPSEVPTTLVVDDGSGEGSPSVPLSKGSTLNVSGTRIDVSVDDVIRAMGQRVPDVNTSQKCWRVAFVLAHPSGTTPSASDIAKVEAYRARFTQWFTTATDGRGTMDTRLLGTGCGPSAGDGGTPVVDAGMPEDAGTVAPDAGTVETDAGTEFADAGCEGEVCGTDAGAPIDDTPQGGGNDAGFAGQDDSVGKLTPGCGCQSATALPLPALLFLFGLAWLRSRCPAPRGRW